MKAVRIHRNGGPEVLQVDEIPRPVPGPGEVLVRVHACALNHLDLWVRRGLPKLPPAFPHILGSDIAGVVEATGPEAGPWVPGDEVVAYPGISCGQCSACHTDRQPLCRQFRTVGAQTPGGYAEWVVLPATSLARKPRPLSFVEAASIPVVFVTAWHMLVALANIKPGEDVLIWGAGSGVGTAAVQVAKVRGARVIAVAAGAEKCEKAAALGADHTIDRQQADVAAEVRRLTHKKGVEVVVEHTGAATWPISIQSLAYGGRLVTCGATTGAEGMTNLQVLFAKQLTLFGSYLGSKVDFLQVLPLFDRGALRPVLDRVFPLDEARRAHEWLESGAHFGKVVLTVA